MLQVQQITCLNSKFPFLSVKKEFATMAGKNKNNQMSDDKISASAKNLPDGTALTEAVRADLVRRRDACGYDSWNQFFKECLFALKSQTRGGDLISHPPVFVMQERSDEQFVRDRWGKSKS